MYTARVKATLRLHQKKVFKNSLLVEMKLWEVPKTHKYPDGIKYSLIAIHLNKKTRVLMDNHTPKGHHYHLDDNEFKYEFSDMDQLVNDFRAFVKIHLGVSL